MIYSFFSLSPPPPPLPRFLVNIIVKYTAELIVNCLNFFAYPITTSKDQRVDNEKQHHNFL